MFSEKTTPLQNAIRDVANFPKKGVVFKDITPILGDGALFSLSLDAILEPVKNEKIDKIIGIDARGFIFGAALADRLGIGFVPVRKKGKLPYETESISYSLEYGEAEIEIHRDAIQKGENVFLVDDLLATGGSAAAAIHLIEKIGGNLLAASFLIELSFLNGREKLNGTPAHAALVY